MDVFLLTGSAQGGELLEWNEELEENEPTHRHTSHLYPLYPGRQISLEETPELAEACRRTLELRGEESTGWALAWRICLWARLHDGEKAYGMLKKQLRPVNGSNPMNYQQGGEAVIPICSAHTLPSRLIPISDPAQVSRKC